MRLCRLTALNLNSRWSGQNTNGRTKCTLIHQSPIWSSMWSTLQRRWTLSWWRQSLSKTRRRAFWWQTSTPSLSFRKIVLSICRLRRLRIKVETRALLRSRGWSDWGPRQRVWHCVWVKGASSWNEKNKMWFNYIYKIGIMTSEPTSSFTDKVVKGLSHKGD